MCFTQVIVAQSSMLLFVATGAAIRVHFFECGAAWHMRSCTWLHVHHSRRRSKLYQCIYHDKWGCTCKHFVVHASTMIIKITRMSQQSNCSNVGLTWVQLPAKLPSPSDLVDCACGRRVGANAPMNWADGLPADSVIWDGEDRDSKLSCERAEGAVDVELHEYFVHERQELESRRCYGRLDGRLPQSKCGRG